MLLNKFGRNFTPTRRLRSAAKRKPRPTSPAKPIRMKSI